MKEEIDVQKIQNEIYMVRDLRDISPLAVVRGFGKTIQEAVMDMDFRKLKVVGFAERFTHGK